MKTKNIVLIAIAVILVLIVTTFFKYQGWRNYLITLEEGTKSSWAQVENVYQRRYDLIPNLVETVKGYAKHEKETLENVTAARAKMGGMLKLPKGALNNKAAMAKYREAQASLGGALQRLMMVSEKYPDLKANQNFMALQDELSGTENRIATERRRYNQAARIYNEKIRQFPYYIVAGRMGFEKVEYYESDKQAKIAPKVKF